MVKTKEVSKEIETEPQETTKAPGKPTVSVQLECAHKITFDARPNPRKDWPSPIVCLECKRKKRIVYIHTQGFKTQPSLSISMRPLPKKKRVRKK